MLEPEQKINSVGLTFCSKQEKFVVSLMKL